MHLPSTTIVRRTQLETRFLGLLRSSSKSCVTGNPTSISILRLKNSRSIKDTSRRNALFERFIQYPNLVVLLGIKASMFSKAFLIASAFVATASAASVTSGAVSATDNSNILVCISVPPNKCLPYDFDLYGSLNAPPGFTCNYYASATCTGTPGTGSFTSYAQCTLTK
ncbi:hypothetical protein BDP27DRAFT_237983 [Rhodocollybia butyracea]|uniref:Uncharacterized protein n=1 Tax=Rhodocollybia butyracea TaxID=206335 RepID=A0A9P5PDW5_9AGAR|nr:hypothetical protein BDP27DRAFT_237983 [Rhodocollybia butyracea]